MKIFILISSNNSNECIPFDSLDKLHKYACYWFLSKEEADILIDTMVYWISDTNYFTIQTCDLNPYIEGGY